MGLFLQILGWAFVLIIVALAVSWYLVRRKLARFLSDLDALTTESGVPSSLTLVPTEKPAFAHADRVGEAITSLVDRGFTRAGAFQIQEMPGLLLCGLVHVEDRILAVVYDNQQMGVWVDVACEQTSGEEITVSNAPSGGELDSRPGTRKIFDREKKPLELLETLRAERGQGPFVEYSPDDFATRFEEAYAREMEWRIRRGGVSVDEVRRVAEGMEESFSLEQIEMAHRVQRVQDARKLYEECLEAFAKQSSMDAREWEELREEMVVLHELMTPEDVVAACESLHDLDDDDLPLLEELERARQSAMDAFEWFRDQLPEERRCRRLGEVSKPVVARFYVAAEQ